MKDLLYRTVQFLPKHKNNEVLTGRCLEVLHGFCKKYKLNDIAVSFPEWSNDTVGDKLTLVSENALHLDSLLAQRYFTEMVSREYFVISELQPVTHNVDYAYFVRNQGIDGGFPKAEARKLKRLKMRAASRGEVYQQHLINQPQHAVLKHYHSIKISSTGSGDKFRLNIQRELTTFKDTGVVNSYGLSNKFNERYAVPII